MWLLRDLAASSFSVRQRRRPPYVKQTNDKEKKHPVQNKLFVHILKDHIFSCFNSKQSHVQLMLQPVGPVWCSEHDVALPIPKFNFTRLTKDRTLESKILTEFLSFFLSFFLS
jgi:hypothetical protein